jgi:signal transduction histidine kinase
VDGVEVLLVQLFQNLISNAIKYHGEQSPRIRISAEAEEDGWVICVKDNGRGIDSKHFDYIFGVFRRLEGERMPGTGIGLAICKAAVERLGGRIWVESTRGEGSCFCVYLPNAASR